MRTVSAVSLSKGIVGCVVSSKDALHHSPVVVPWVAVYARAPISEEALSPIRRIIFAGSQPRKTREKDEGGRNPGKGRHGGVSVMVVTVFSLESMEDIECERSISGPSEYVGAWIT